MSEEIEKNSTIYKAQLGNSPIINSIAFSSVIAQDIERTSNITDS